MNLHGFYISFCKLYALAFVYPKLVLAIKHNV